jgi:hypothetical protein
LFFREFLAAAGPGDDARRVQDEALALREELGRQSPRIELHPRRGKKGI